MYLLFRYHHMKPSEFEELRNGEKTVLRAFMHYEVEEREKAWKI